MLALQAGGGFEDPALPFDMFEIFFAAGVGHVFAENGDALVARHFVEQCGRDHFHHGLGCAVELRLYVERGGC